MAKQTQKPLGNTELSSFAGQIALVLKSGISPQEGLSIMLEDSQNPKEQELLTVMNNTLAETGSFYQALLATEVFPNYMLKMVDIGETTGNLDEVMAALSQYYNREDAISKSVKSALTYPLIIMGMMTLVIIVLLTKIMPVFQQVFRQLGMEMTGLSAALLAMGEAFSRYAMVLVAILVLIVIGLVYFTKTHSGQKKLRQLGSHIPFSRDIYDKIASCRLADGMFLTLKSGMTPEQGLEFSADLIDDPLFSNKIDVCKTQLSQGEDLPKVLHQAGLFSGIYSRMIALAGKTGNMDEVMGQIAARYQEEVDDKITSFISVLEPTLVVILSVIVGIILFSVMLPLMGIMLGL